MLRDSFLWELVTMRVEVSGGEVGVLAWGLGIKYSTFQRIIWHARTHRHLRKHWE